MWADGMARRERKSQNCMNLAKRTNKCVLGRLRGSYLGCSFLRKLSPTRIWGGEKDSMVCAGYLRHIQSLCQGAAIGSNWAV